MIIRRQHHAYHQDSQPTSTATELPKGEPHSATHPAANAGTTLFNVDETQSSTTPPTRPRSPRTSIAYTRTTLPDVDVTQRTYSETQPYLQYRTAPPPSTIHLPAEPSNLLRDDTYLQYLPAPTAFTFRLPDEPLRRRPLKAKTHVGKISRTRWIQDEAEPSLEAKTRMGKA